MKIYISFILIFVGIHNVGISQDIDDECLTKQRYLAAYEYVQADGINVGKSIHVMNALVMIHRVSFIDDLKKYPVEREIAETDRTNYDIFNTEIQYPPIPVELGIPENTYADLILIYSDIKDDMLVVELVPRKKYNDEYSKGKPIYVLDVQGVKRSHFPNTPKEALMFTQTYKYLFLFNEDGTIKDVFRHEVIYG